MAHDSSKLDNEEPGCQAPELSSRCVNNCGFFGSPATSNFCSRCYAEVVVKTKPSYPAAEKISASDPSSKLLGEPAGGMAELGLQLASFAAKSVAEERAVSDPAAQIQESEIGVAELGTRAVEIEVSSVASTSSRTDVPGIVTDVLRAATVFEVSGHQPQRPTPNRCLTCRKRVGLTGFKCRCGDVFCALHRYSDKHNCSYDYKAAGREAIAKANPIVVARKIEKI